MAVPKNPFTSPFKVQNNLSEKKVFAAIDNLREGLLLIKGSGIIECINPAAQELLSANVQNPVGRPYEEVVWIASVQRFITEILADGLVREDEAIVDAGSGERYIHLYGTSIEEGGEGASYLVVISDITHLKRLEKMRRDFVANVSHELKTPITVIQGFVETLLNGPLEPAESERFLKSIARQTERLTHLFDDLLMLSRLEQERSRIVTSHQALLPLLSAITQSFEMQAKEKEISLSVECVSDCFADINVNLFEQAIGNLIQNAMEYTSSTGRIVVSAYSRNDACVISVKDTGCGIETAELNRIFERFYRIDKGRSRKYGGTGLGLAIVKHIAQVHGGRVSVKSRIGEGSEFFFEVPVV